MVQKIALVILVGCMVLLYGCTGSNSGASVQSGNTTVAAPSGNGGHSGPVVTAVASQGTPASNGTKGNASQAQAPTGISALTVSDINVPTGDTTGNAYTALPVDDGSDSPVNGS